MSPANRKIERSLNRREALGALGAASLALLAGCSSSPSSPTDTSGGGSTNASACATTPEETAGPYPDRVGMLTNAAYFRQDITEGKGGVPLTLTLSVVDVRASCAVVANAIVEIWQCDATGNYSEYSQPGFDGTGLTFLRGLQTTDSSGRVTFKTIYPGWYSGRATHIHVEIFLNGALVKTTQIAFPEATSHAVYATGVYTSHGQNTTSNASDNVFADGTEDELATLAGDTASGFTGTLTIGVSV